MLLLVLLLVLSSYEVIRVEVILKVVKKRRSTLDLNLEFCLKEGGMG